MGVLFCSTDKLNPGCQQSVTKWLSGETRAGTRLPEVVEAIYQHSYAPAYEDGQPLTAEYKNISLPQITPSAHSGSPTWSKIELFSLKEEGLTIQNTAPLTCAILKVVALNTRRLARKSWATKLSSFGLDSDSDTGLDSELDSDSSSESDLGLSDGAHGSLEDKIQERTKRNAEKKAQLVSTAYMQ